MWPVVVMTCPSHVHMHSGWMGVDGHWIGVAEWVTWWPWQAMFAFGSTRALWMSVITHPFHDLLRPPLNHGPYLICSQITHYYIWVSPHGVYTIAMQLLFNHFSLSCLSFMLPPYGLC